MAAFAVPFGAFADPYLVVGFAFAAPFAAVAVVGLEFAVPFVAACSFEHRPLVVPYETFAAEHLAVVEAVAAAACSFAHRPLLVPFVDVDAEYLGSEPSAAAAAVAYAFAEHPLFVPFVVPAEACCLVVDPFETLAGAC